VRRILLLVTDLEIGGTPTVVRELALRLQQPGSVHVEAACLARMGPVAEQLIESGVPAIALGARHFRELPRVVARLIRLVRDSQIDTVFSFLIHANTAAAIASRFCRGVRFIQSIQTTQRTPRWHWWLQRVVQHSAERVVVPSPSAARVARAWADVPAGKLVVIPNAIDPAEFAVARPSTGEQFRIGFIGRLDPVKRIPDLLSAMGKLGRAFRLDIFGEGRERGNLTSLIAQHGLRQRARLHGAVSSPQEALGQIDLLALPSAAEGFGLVLIEAMAAGVPVVATDVPGICDVVTNEENGLLVPVAAPPQLAQAIRRIAQDVQLRERLIANGRRTVEERYNWRVVLPQYHELLQL
jgi:glycosyltransferase involved in cell wall biosynthesis